jgi:hypothetical protein
MLATDIPIKPSSQFIIFFILNILIGVCVILSSTIHPPIKFLLTSIACTYGFYILWTRGFLLSKNSILAMRLLADRTWILFTKDKAISGELLGNSTVNRRYMVLNFKISGSWRTRSIMLFRDSVEPVLYHDLQLQIQFGR